MSCKYIKHFVDILSLSYIYMIILIGGLCEHIDAYIYITKLLQERPRRSQARREFPDPKAALVKRIFPT